MSFLEIIQRSRQENILFSVLVELTYSCNHTCFFCYNDRKLQGRALSLEQYLHFLQDLHDLQVLNLTLSGGEPLMHPGFWDIGRKARELGFVLRIKSNGYRVSQKVADRLKEELDPYSLELSLHGSSSTTHDRQTGTDGSFSKLMQSIAIMKKAGLRTQLNSVLTKFNEHEIKEMYNLADDLGVILMIDPQVTPRDTGDTTPLSIAAGNDGLKNLFHVQKERGIIFQPQECKSEGLPTGQEEQKHCGAGSSTLAIDPYGNVYPCVAYRQLIGNLHDQTIKEIWSDNRELKKIRQITMKASKLVEEQGSLGNTMTFCPGQAATIYGDPLKLYPTALRILRLKEKIASEK